MTEYIKREELMEFPIRRNHYDRENGNKHFINGIETVLEYAENLPAADVAPVVHGRWIKDNDSFQTDDYYCCYFDYTCSECGEIVNDRYKLPNYYPDCGAKMDGEMEDK